MKFSKRDKVRIAALMRKYQVSREEAVRMFVQSGL